MARLANRNASAAFSSSRSSVSPASMRRRASRHRSRAVWPGVWYGAMSGLVEVGLPVLDPRRIGGEQGPQLRRPGRGVGVSPNSFMSATSPASLGQSATVGGVVRGTS